MNPVAAGITSNIGRKPEGPTNVPRINQVIFIEQVFSVCAHLPLPFWRPPAGPNTHQVERVLAETIIEGSVVVLEIMTRFMVPHRRSEELAEVAMGCRERAAKRKRVPRCKTESVSGILLRPTLIVMGVECCIGIRIVGEHADEIVDPSLEAEFETLACGIAGVIDGEATGSFRTGQVDDIDIFLMEV